jgi:hypothetical protein
MRKLSTITYIFLIIVAIGIGLVSYHVISYEDMKTRALNGEYLSFDERIKGYNDEKSITLYSTITAPFLIILLILYFTSPII